MGLDDSSCVEDVDASTLHFESVIAEELDRFRICLVFFQEYPNRKRLRGIAFSDRNGTLDDYGTGIHIFGYEVNGTARYFGSGFDDGLVDVDAVQAGKGGEKRGMDVNSVSYTHLTLPTN